jgi:hypothetical protein
LALKNIPPIPVTRASPAALPAAARADSSAMPQTKLSPIPHAISNPSFMVSSRAAAPARLGELYSTPARSAIPPR